MLFTIIKPRIRPRQKVAALAVAVGADLLQIVFWPMLAEGFFSPFEDLLDLVVAGILIAVCGFRWQFVLAFFLEAVPGFDLFPTWTALVLTLPTLSADGQGFEVLPGGSAANGSHWGDRSRVGVTGGPTSGPAKRAAHDRRSHDAIEVSAVAVPPVQAPPRQDL